MKLTQLLKTLLIAMLVLSPLAAQESEEVSKCDAAYDQCAEKCEKAGDDSDKCYEACDKAYDKCQSQEQDK